jgi:hypothetical protein
MHPIKIYQYDLDGNFIREYNNITELLFINKFKVRNFYMRLDQNNIYKNYIWSKIFYAKYPMDKIIKPQRKTTNKKTILQFTKDGKLIAEHIGIKKLANELGVYPRNIRLALVGKRKTFRGYIWKYKD